MAISIYVPIAERQFQPSSHSPPCLDYKQHRTTLCSALIGPFSAAGRFLIPGMQPLMHSTARAVWKQQTRHVCGLGARMEPGLVQIHPMPGTGLSQCLRCGLVERSRRSFFSKSFLRDVNRPSGSTPESIADPATEGERISSSSRPTELPSSQENRRSTTNRRFSDLMDRLQARVVNASQTLNDMTGYSAIETIKANNASLEDSLAKAQSDVRAARQAYKTSNARRSATQREVTTLLARKDAWSPTDLERFTELYRMDHELEGEVAGAQAALTEAEADEQDLGQRLNAGILKRYHEEQIWSDRIRRASTWGTWGLMGMNFLLFIAFQFVAEPWRRKRLVRGVVEEEKEVLEEVRAKLEALKGAVEAGRRDSATTGDALNAPDAAQGPNVPLPLGSIPRESSPSASELWKSALRDPAVLGAAMADLFSERRVDLRMKDISLLAAEGIVAGAAVAGGIAMLMLRRS